MGYVSDLDDSKNITFLFKLQDGIEKRSYGLNVARLANLPEKMIKRATYFSRLLEKDVSTRQQLYYFNQLLQFMKKGKNISTQELVIFLEEINRISVF